MKVSNCSSQGAFDCFADFNVFCLKGATNVVYNLFLMIFRCFGILPRHHTCFYHLHNTRKQRNRTGRANSSNQEKKDEI